MEIKDILYHGKNNFWGKIW